MRGDLLWNLAAFGATGVCGLLLNVCIGILYDAESLGIFNQVFAVFIFGSQFAVLGVHYSVLKELASRSESIKEHPPIIVAGLSLALLFGGLTMLVLYATCSWIGELLSSPAVGVGIAYIAPGVLFFALNKVLLNTLNGLRRMRAFALFQTLRVSVMTVSLLLIAALGADKSMLAVVLTFAEVAVFLLILPATARHWWGGQHAWFTWLRKHLHFGVRSSMSGVLVELNTRVDVLMLGYFVSDRLVGFYSFAALVAEGFFQILVVVRNNYNPILAKMISAREIDQLRSIVRKAKWRTYAASMVVGGIAVIGFPVLGWLMSHNTDFSMSWAVFAVLMLGIVASSGYTPFNNILLQAGHPATHTAMIVALVAANALLNFLFIPYWGILGAAAATGLSFVFSVLLLQVLSKTVVGVRL